MTIREMQALLGAEGVCCHENMDREVFSACGCDLMSDVLAYVKDQAVLLTGLVNPQVIRTAEMMDMICIVFVRSKTPTDEMIGLAQDHGIVIMQSDKRLYEACGILYSNGLAGNKVKE